MARPDFVEKTFTGGFKTVKFVKNFSPSKVFHYAVILGPEIAIFSLIKATKATPSFSMLHTQKNLPVLTLFFCMIITMKNKTKLGVAWGQSYEYTCNILHLLKDKLPTRFLQSSLSYEHQGFIQYTDLLYGERFRDSQLVGVESTHVQCTLQENSRIVGSQLKVLQSLVTFPLNSGIKSHQPHLQCTITEPKKKKKKITG